jgi:hypothetical protein
MAAERVYIVTNYRGSYIEEPSYLYAGWVMTLINPVSNSLATRKYIVCTMVFPLYVSLRRSCHVGTMCDCPTQGLHSSRVSSCAPLTSHSQLAARRVKVVVILDTVKSSHYRRRVISETTPWSLLADHTAPGSVRRQGRGS